MDDTSSSLVIQFIYVAVSLLAAAVVWNPTTFGLRMRFVDSAGECFSCGKEKSIITSLEWKATL